jgi:hypothetical protein
MVTKQMNLENSEKEKKELYVSPKVEIIEIRVEKGFAASPVGSGTFGNDSWGSGTW